VGPIVALAAVAACSNVQASAAYCEQARKAEATADPLKDDAVANDPTKLEAAMLARVQLYTELASAAPSEIRDKARTLQDAFARLYNALKAIGFDRTRANGDSGVRAVLDDAKVGAAVTALQSYGQKACGIPAP
jgi:hypothetical protein